MERLTEMNESKSAYFYPKCFQICGGTGYKQECDHCEVSDKVCEKLGRYEDLEEQGKLLKLPCAVGDTVYTIYDDEECGAFIEEPKVVEVSTHRIWIDSMYFDYEDFGKTVFLTKEEAETALKEFISEGVD